MARKNSYGKYILSAGEIGSFTVCPEAWFLKECQQVQPVYTDSMKEGMEQHRAWESSLDDAVYFSRSVKLIIFLIMAAIVFGVLRFFMTLKASGV